MGAYNSNHLQVKKYVDRNRRPATRDDYKLIFNSLKGMSSRDLLYKYRDYKYIDGISYFGELSKSQRIEKECVLQILRKRGLK